MPKQQHHSEDEQLYHKGANFDDDASILAAAEKGFYVDAKNMRPTELGGHALAIEKIKGETLLYPNSDNRCNVGTNLPIVGNYECLFSVNVINHIVELWADRDKLKVPFIRIDGWICLYPKTLAKFPMTVDFPPQVHKNDSCVGGEICVTDYNTAPYVLNVEDMLKNNGIDPLTNLRDTVTYPCTQKYFDEFDIAKYQTQLNRPLDHPIFIELSTSGTPNSIGRTEVHGSGGLKVGAYQYSTRLSNAAGDTTLFSENTPIIPVPKGLSAALGTWPGIKTYGAAASTASGRGIHIRFRVANLLDFDTIEIKRTAWIVGAAIGTLGLEEIVHKLTITSGEFSIVDFYDYDNSFLSPATPEEVVDTLSSIESAKAIRYYNSRLFLMNVKYASRDITGKVIFDQIGGKEMIPFTQQIGKLGYEDIWNNVYRKSNMRGEKFGFASVFFDDNGARSFALDIPQFTNAKMPERRDPMNNDSKKLSTTPTFNADYEMAQDSSVTTVSKTFEVFDLVDGVTKTVHKADSSGTGSANSGTGLLNILNDGNKDGQGHAYGPFNPINDADAQTDELNLIINPEVKVDGSGFVAYNPKGFAPNFYALGMGLAGIASMPPWVKAFSVVRTAAAGRVIAQGQSFYQMDDANPDIEKVTDKVWWQSPDVFSQIVNYTSVIQGQLASLQMQAVSAVGFFTELYNGHHMIGLDPTSDVSDGIDMVNYCRILRDNGEINIGTSGSVPVVGISWVGKKYVAFQSWRNSINTPITPNQLLTPSSFVPDGRGSQHRSKPYSIQFSGSIYANQATSAQVFYDDTTVKNWHEPVYVMNVVNPNADVPPTSGTKEYFETGAYVKVDSIIGVSDGNNKSYYLVDERWADCIPALKSFHPTNQDDRYIILNDGSGNEEVWLNVTFKTALVVTAIKTAIDTNGFYLSTQPDGSQYSVTGIYTHTNTSDRLFKIEFNQSDANGVPFIPAKGRYIMVRYNHNAPVEVFGGDTYIGTFNYAPVDCKYKSNEIGLNNHLEPETAADEIYMDRPMPYHDFHIDENVYVIRSTTGLNKIQDNNRIKLTNDLRTVSGKVRQQLVSGIVESRINTALDFRDRFPEVNYVMRPYLWDTATPSTNLHTQYFTDYPNEDQQFGWGGFRFIPAMNADYSEIPTNLKHFNKPVGFKEVTHYCSRVTWSRKRPTNKMGAPGLLTFPPLQIFDLGDETGDIKFAYDDLSGKYGSNLYAFTEHGTALLVTEKSILTEMSGAQLASIAPSNTTVIQQGIWLSKNIGMNDEWWRSAAEWNNALYFTNKVSSYRFTNTAIQDIGSVKYYSKIKSVVDKVGKNYTTDVKAVYDLRHHEYWWQQCTRVKSMGHFIPSEISMPTGSPINLLQVFFTDTAPTYPQPTNSISMQVLDGDIISIENDQIFIVDLTLLDPYTNFYITNNQTGSINIQAPNYSIPPGISIVNKVFAGETYYVSQLAPPSLPVRTTQKISLTLCNMPIWSEKTKETWVGEFGFEFDKYAISNEDRMFGSRKVETWELDKGTNMNGTPVKSWVMGATSGGADHMHKSKEFFRIRVGGEVKPTKIDFYDTIEQFNAGNVQASLDSVLNPNFYLKNYGAAEQYIPRKTAPPRQHMQGTQMLFQMHHDITGTFRIPYTSIEFKDLV